jgi:3-hydroxybutyryl-CoA dehydratase
LTARRYFEDYAVGEVFIGANGGGGHTVTEADISVFASTAADTAAIHMNEAFARNSVWKTRIAHGTLTFAISEGLLMQTHIYESIEEALFVSLKDVRYLKPVLIGDTLTASFRVLDKRPDPDNPQYGIITLFRDVRNQRGETVLTGETASRVRMRVSETSRS